ncbi:MAG TPA: hypothetical protein ENG40_00935, partial [Thermoprotei archaeon]|nr:hypothetical protein [Thermoprotei archaeon]
MKEGVLIVSIDLELAWGLNYRILRDPSSARVYLKIIKRRSRRNIDILLKFSRRFRIPFTWGVVGGLLKSFPQNSFFPYLSIFSKFRLNKDLYIDERLWYGLDI